MGGSSGVYTEIQPGSFMFMDNEYSSTEQEEDFHQSLFVLSTVMSDTSSHRGWVVVDAGSKAVHAASAKITVQGDDRLTYRLGGDEHGIIEGPQEVLDMLKIGTQLKLVPGHCDPTVNMYDAFIGVRDSCVIA